MAFDAGSIIGDLQLKTTEFSAGVQRAEAEAEGGSSRIGGFFTAAANSVTGEFGEAIAAAGEALAGLAEGNYAGAILAVGEAFKALVTGAFELAEGVAEQSHAMGLAALKTGQTAESMSVLSGVAKQAHVDLATLTQGLTLLEDKASLAAHGDAASAKAFERVGISAKEAGELMEQPKELFDRIQTSLSGMASAGDRAAAAKGLLGRAGIALIPVLAASKEEVDATGKSMAAFGDITTDADVKSGEAMAKLEANFGFAIDGIAKAAAQPVFEFLQSHSKEISEDLLQFSRIAREIVPPAIELITAAVKAALPILEAFLNTIDNALSFVGVSPPVSQQSPTDDEGGGKGGNTYNVTVTHDASESGAQFGERVHSHIRQAVESQRDEYQAGASQALVEQGVAGD